MNENNMELMSENDLQLLNIISRIVTLRRKRTSTKTIQKLIYLVQEAGCSLGFDFDYSINYYGPFSEGLNFELYKLDCQGYIQTDISPMWITGTAVDDSQTPLDEVADKIIKEFVRYTDEKLEQYATILYVTRGKQKVTWTQTINAVKRIKGKKYSNAVIAQAINKMRGTFKIEFEKRDTVWQIRRAQVHEYEDSVVYEGAETDARQLWDIYNKDSFGLYKVTFELVEGNGDKCQQQ
jgi:uncharacterized protein YwgA